MEDVVEGHTYILGPVYRDASLITLYLVVIRNQH